MLILCISFCVYIIVYVYVHLVVFVLFFVFCRSSFSTLILLVGSFDLKNRLPYNLYCVGGDVKHCSLAHSPLLQPPLEPPLAATVTIRYDTRV